MREILFRGKQSEGRWVEGVYFRHDTVKVCFSSDDPRPRHLIIQDGFCDWGFEPPIHCVDVDLNTVGQFTGLTDKNGKKIFEGDIVRLCKHAFEWEDPANWEFETGVIAFEDGCFVINEIYSYDGYNELSCIYDDIHSDDGYDEHAIFEVIGNIHDNSELLEVDNG